MRKNLLTIVIPTYNRCSDLELCLSYVIPQVVQYMDEVGIYISDNASTDDTKRVVDQKIQEHPDIITYHCQPENLTASPNFNDAVHRVDSEYVYMLSDDDIIVPGFVSIMLNMIKVYPKVNYFYLNRYVASMEMKGVSVWKKNFGLDYVKLYSEGGELIKEHLDGPSCISANLFRRQLWIDATKDMKEDCPGYVWLSILMHGIVRAKNAAFVPYPMFTARMPAVQRYSANWDWYYIYGLAQLFKHLDKIYSGIYDSWINYTQVENRRVFMMKLCGVSQNKKLYRERSEDMKKHMHSRWFKFMYDCMVSFVPAWFAKKILYSLIQSFKIFEIIKRKAL